MQDSDHRMRPSPQKRCRKNVIQSDPEDDEMPPARPNSGTGLPLAPPEQGQGPIYSMDTDISQLEAPTFTTLDRGPSQPMLQLNWDHKLNLLGKKVVNPMIHCCDKCLKPILIYGRMIPCKHVFCLTCAQASEKAACSRCGDKVARVEQAGLGSIYMCSHGGSRYGNDGCRRTYLSQRDLQAHIQHRHMKQIQSTTTSNHQSAALPTGLPSAAAIAEATAALVNARNKQQVRTGSVNFGSPPPNLRCDSKFSPSVSTSVSGQTSNSHISVIGGASQPSRQSNLITVPIQDQSKQTQQVGGDTNVIKYGAYGSSGYYGRHLSSTPPTARTTNPTSGFSSGQFSQPPPNFYTGGNSGGYQSYSGGSASTPLQQQPPGYYRR